MIPHAPVGRCAALLVLLGLTVAVLVLAHTAWSGDGATPADAQSARTDEARRAVVLAVQRDHRLHVFDAATLEPLGSIRVHNLADSVEARPDGGMLFIRQADTTDGNGCCGLFALDLGTREMCRLITPSSRVPLTDNGRVFNQRGNAGIEVFDASTLERLPTIAAPGVYNLLPSPDGRWLFGINRFRGTTVDLVDALGGTLLRRLPVRLPDGDGDGREPAGWVTGAWLDGRFILYAAEGGSASLWTLTPDTEELGP